MNEKESSDFGIRCYRRLIAIRNAKQSSTENKNENQPWFRCRVVECVKCEMSLQIKLKQKFSARLVAGKMSLRKRHSVRSEQQHSFISSTFITTILSKCVKFYFVLLVPFLKFENFRQNFKKFSWNPNIHYQTIFKFTNKHSLVIRNNWRIACNYFKNILRNFTIEIWSELERRKSNKFC